HHSLLSLLRATVPHPSNAHTETSHVHTFGLRTSERAQRGQPLLTGIRTKWSPTVRVDGVHFRASAEPAPLPTAQFGGKLVGIVNEAQEQREVQALVLWHVVDIDRTRLDEDRTEQIRSR